MKGRRLIAIVAAAGCLFYSGELFAKGSGGGHSGGHGSGGHASGGHASGGHASGGHTSAGHASPRGSQPHGTAVTRTTSSTTATSAGASTWPAHSRPRPGSAVIVPGVAVPRAAFIPPMTAPAAGLLPARVWPYYGPAFGFGAFSSFYYPWSSMFGLGYDDDYTGAWSHSGFAATYPFDPFDATGSLRLQVDPKDAEVYVDGYFAGVVDDFDGHFQHLDLIPGSHHVEIRRLWYDPLAFDIVIQAHHKETYRGRLKESELGPRQ